MQPLLSSIFAFARPAGRRRLYGAAFCVGLLLAGCNRRVGGVLDQTTPQATIHSLIHAIDEQNADHVRSCFLAQTPGQRAFVQAIGHLSETSALLQSRLTDRFGRQAARDVVGTGGPSEEDFQRFEQGSRQMNGSAAILTDSLGHTMELRNDNGAWKIVPDGQGSGPAAMTRATTAMNQLAEILSDVAGDVGNAGKYSTAQDVKSEILRRQTVVMTAKGSQ